MNVVCNALLFHMICDWGTKSLPFTVRKTDDEPPGIAPGESAAIWGCGVAPSQLWKSTIAVQVLQPEISRVRAAMKAMRTRGKGLPGSNRQERIPASLSRAFPIVTLGASAQRGPIVGRAKCLDNSSAINGHSLIGVRKAPPANSLLRTECTLSHRGADVKLFPAWRNESKFVLSIKPEPVSTKLGMGA